MDIRFDAAEKEQQHAAIQTAEVKSADSNYVPKEGKSKASPGKKKHTRKKGTAGPNKSEAMSPEKNHLFLPDKVLAKKSNSKGGSGVFEDKRSTLAMDDADKSSQGSNNSRHVSVSAWQPQFSPSGRRSLNRNSSQKEASRSRNH